MSAANKNPILDVYGVFALTVALIYSLMAGLRSIDVGTDTSTYMYIFETVLNGGQLNREVEVGFNSLILFINLFGGVEFFLFFVSLAVILLCTNIFDVGLNWKFFVSFLFLLLSPFFYGHTLNILRQGLSFALIVYMLQLKLCKNKTSIVLVVFAGSFHNIGLLFGMLAFFSRFVSLKMTTMFWFLCAAVGLFVATNSVVVNWALSFVNSDYLLGYFSSNSLDYKFGLRIDFLFFSFALVCLGAVLMRIEIGSLNRVVPRSAIQYIYKSYLVMNGFGLLFLQMPYADRWLNWSWSLIPFFLIWVYDSIRAASIKLFILFIALMASPIMLLSQLNLL